MLADMQVVAEKAVIVGQEFRAPGDEEERWRIRRPTSWVKGYGVDMTHLPNIDSVASEPWNAGDPGAAEGTAFGRSFPASGSERAAMLLVHGFGEHHGRYARQIQYLTERGVTVFAFDLPGHGRSSGRRALVDVNALVGTVHTALMRVAEYGRARGIAVALMGHSMGGLLAAATAIRAPGAVDGMFLSSPALLVGAGYPDWYKNLGNLLGLLAPWAPASSLDPKNISRIAEYVQDYSRDPLVFHKPVPALTAATMLSAGHTTRAQAGTITIPTRIIHGTNDAIADIAGSREFAATSAAARERAGLPPSVTLTEFPGAFHEIFNDLDADAAYVQLDEWLEDLIGS